MEWLQVVHNTNHYPTPPSYKIILVYSVVSSSIVVPIACREREISDALKSYVKHYTKINYFHKSAILTSWGAMAHTTERVITLLHW